MHLRSSNFQVTLEDVKKAAKETQRTMARHREPKGVQGRARDPKGRPMGGQGRPPREPMGAQGSQRNSEDRPWKPKSIQKEAKGSQKEAKGSQSTQRDLKRQPMGDQGRPQSEPTKGGGRRGEMGEGRGRVRRDMEQYQQTPSHPRFGRLVTPDLIQIETVQA